MNSNYKYNKILRLTLSDIAQKANISKMTVSRALTGKGRIAKETSEKIQHIANEMGYEPNLVARSLSSKCSRVIGVIIPRTISIFLDNFNAQVLSGVMDVADRNGYRIMMLPVEPHQEKETQYLIHARSNLLDGMALLRSKIGDPNLPQLAESGFPYILINNKMVLDTYNFVDTENVMGAKTAVRYLYECGYRRIAFIMGPIDETNCLDRLQGYKEALSEFGLEYRDEWVENGGFDKQIAYECTGKLLKSKKIPEAIFCSDDEMAVGAMERLKKEGFSIPGDMALIGFDDQEFSKYLRPALTTIRQPMHEIGEIAVELLIKLIEGIVNPPVHEILGVELVVRESC